MPSDLAQLEAELKQFVAPSYPEMDIRVSAWDRDSTRLAIYFTDAKFECLYPYQRWHYLTHLIPQEYQDTHLMNSVWFELAPGEKPEDLRYPDEDLLDEITDPVMKCVKASQFFERLDDLICPAEGSVQRAACHGDFRHSKSTLLTCGFTEDELFDVLHVLMREGGFCDCEILYNVAEYSRLKAEYWIARSEGRATHDPHGGNGTSP